jgi:hypothetical protein
MSILLLHCIVDSNSKSYSVDLLAEGLSNLSVNSSKSKSSNQIPSRKIMVILTFHIKNFLSFDI